MHALTPESDRMVLTVRMCKDGNREWLSSDGRIALVFFERGKWWARDWQNFWNSHFHGDTLKEFNTENKTVRIHGHLEDGRPPFIKDLFVEAKIWLTDQTIAALPEGAVILDGTFSYIFVGKKEVENVIFEKLKVIAGTTDQGYTEVKLIDTIPGGNQIVVNGAYYVYAQSMAEELEHDH